MYKVRVSLLGDEVLETLLFIQHFEFTQCYELAHLIVKMVKISFIYILA